MTTTHIKQILDNTSPLKTAGRARCEDTLYITRATFALYTEAALTPQYTLTHDTLSSIVSRFYTLIMHKRPEMLAMLEMYDSHTFFQ